MVFEIIQDYYATTLKYDFYDILIEYNAKLSTYYSLKGDISKFSACKTKYLNYISIQSKIDEAYLLFSTINCYAASNQKPSSEALAAFENELRHITCHDDIYLQKCYIYLSKLLLYNFQHQQDKVSHICDELMLHLDTKDNAYRQSFKGIANAYKISTLMQFREYAKGIKYIEKNIHNLYGINWFEAMDTKLKFALNLKEVDLCKEILKQVYSHKSIENLPPNIKEKWFIYEGYLVFYDNYINNGKYKFNLGKLINLAPHYFHDKSGYNLSLIILQLLFQLARKNKDEAFQLINSLRLYKSRYLKAEN